MTPVSRRRMLAATGGAVPLLAASAAATAAAGANASPPRGPVPGMIQAAAFGAVGDGRADDTDALQAALDAAFGGPDAGFLQIPPGTYRITRPLSVHRRTDADVVSRSGILGHGARLVSAIADKRPVLEIRSEATVRYMLVEGLEIRGNGREGHGLHVDCQNRGTYFYNFCLRDIVVEGCGGDGCRLVGNIFEGQIVNSYFRDNGGNGATFSHGDNDTVLSAVHAMGCVFGGNRGHGAQLLRAAADVSFHGCYFLLNGSYGLSARFGCPLLSHCGFENNHERAGSFEKGGAGLDLMVAGTLIGCVGYSIRNQTHLVRAYITNDLSLIGCTGDGGGNARGARLAILDGTPEASISVIGCRGGIDTSQRIRPVVLGRQGTPVTYSDQWDGEDLFAMGAYRLWVDAQGTLRIKRGHPTSDGDGRPVGA